MSACVSGGGGSSRRASAAQDRSHARRQLAQAERLGHVIVGAEIEAGDAVRFARPRRQHDDRHRRGFGPAAQQPADLGTAEHRQVEIENDEIGRLVRNRSKGGISAAHNVDLGVA